MALFAISAVNNSVNLDGNRQSQAAFTVSNSSGRVLRGRAKLVADDATANGWLSLTGEPERDFPIAGTQQFIARIAVPKTAAAKNYNFRLDVVDVEKPDESLVQGPSVTFVVPTAPPARQFPWWIPLLVLGVVGVAAAVFFLLPRSAIVPKDLGNVSVIDASKKLEDAGFKVASTAPLEEFNDTVAAGMVIRTIPPGGSSAGKGEAIQLVVSKGVEMVTIPADVINQKVEDATPRLTALGLSFTTEDVFSNLANRMVVDTDPKPNSSVKKGSPVKVFVSKGADLITIPSLSGLKTDVATNKLNDIGLPVGGVRTDCSQTVPVDLVIGSAPAEGTQIKRGTPIALIKSVGPAFSSPGRVKLCVRVFPIDPSIFERSVDPNIFRFAHP
jgi:beta-lactam-binding protein with PASTA domain